MDHVSISRICRSSRKCYIRLGRSGGRLFLHTMDSTQNSLISNVSVGSDDFRKRNVSVGSTKEMNKKEIITGMINVKHLHLPSPGVIRREYLELYKPLVIK